MARCSFARPFDDKVERLFVYAASLFAAALPWFFKFAPSTDLPNHVAIGAIIARLLRGTEQFYQFNLQPAPYWLAYAFLVPCVGASVFTVTGNRWFERAWPPIATNLVGYYVGQGTGNANVVFDGGHIPIALGRHPMGGLQNGRIVFGDFDYVLLRDDAVDVESGCHMASAGFWRLYERSGNCTPTRANQSSSDDS